MALALKRGAYTAAAAANRMGVLGAAMEGYFCMGIQYNWPNAPNWARFHATARTLCA